ITPISAVPRARISASRTGTARGLPERLPRRKGRKESGRYPPGSDPQIDFVSHCAKDSVPHLDQSQQSRDDQLNVSSSRDLSPGRESHLSYHNDDQSPRKFQSCTDIPIITWSGLSSSGSGSAIKPIP